VKLPDRLYLLKPHFMDAGKGPYFCPYCAQTLGLLEFYPMLKSLERAEKIESNEPERLFAERLARQHGILNQTRGTSERPNVSALARQFNVARKTIQRDLSDLVRRGRMDPVLYPEWNDSSGAG